MEGTTAEIWALSCHEAGLSCIENGSFCGKTLREALALHPEWLGEKNRTPGECPVLIKLLDAEKPLSVQVHPSDETAHGGKGERGKTEMWHILRAEPGAAIYYGLQRPLSEAELIRHAQEGTIEQDLRRIPVHPGETYAVPPGTIHALGAGIVAAEVQQSSDTTFRVYDYDRRDEQGNRRPLQLARAVQTVNFTPDWPEIDNMRDKEVPLNDRHQTEIFHCDFFRVFRMEGKMEDGFLCGDDSFQAWLWLQGQGMLIWQQEKERLSPGDCFFLPAGLGEYAVQGTGEALRVCI